MATYLDGGLQLQQLPAQGSAKRANREAVRVRKVLLPRHAEEGTGPVFTRTKGLWAYYMSPDRRTGRSGLNGGEVGGRYWD